MYRIEKKPYKLIGKMQNYEWGTKNDNAFIPSWLGITPQNNLPYAEYWIGVHPKAVTDILIDDKNVSLFEALQKFPKEILGERVSAKFNNTLPFLLKVLSIEKALSIQTHPDKKLAKELHQKDPINYPDENHKPEIAIAIDKLKAIVGLLKFDDFINTLNEYSELRLLLDEEDLKLLGVADSETKEETIKKLYSQILTSPKEKLEACILKLKYNFEIKEKLNESEKQFLLEFENYGLDVGLISILLFNFVNLEKGEAIFTPAGIPHAYIKGNIIECMANSDNVVRAGLTPKYKDVDTLSKMLVVDSSKCKVDIIKKDSKIVYKTSTEEFELEQLILDESFIQKENNGINVVLILNGSVLILCKNKEYYFSKGDTILIPAIVDSYKIIGNDESEIFRVRVPK